MAAQRKNSQLEAIKHLQQPQHLPDQQPDSPRVVRRRVEKKPKRNFYTLKMLLTLCGIGVFGLMFIQLYMDAQLNHIHYQMQRVQMEINLESAINEQLSAQISELSQHARIIEIATERGLSVSENIINIQR